MLKTTDKEIKKLAKKIIGRYFPPGKKISKKNVLPTEDFDEKKATASCDAFLQSGQVDTLIFKNKGEQNN